MDRPRFRIVTDCNERKKPYLQAQAHQLAAGRPGRASPERGRDAVGEDTDVPVAQRGLEVEEGVLQLCIHKLVLVGARVSGDDGIAVGVPIFVVLVVVRIIRGLAIRRFVESECRPPFVITKRNVLNALWIPRWRFVEVFAIFATAVFGQDRFTHIHIRFLYIRKFLVTGCCILLREQSYSWIRSSFSPPRSRGSRMISKDGLGG